jgi:hypothetical protein
MSGLNSHLWSQHSVACTKFMNITINLSSSCTRLIIYDELIKFCHSWQMLDRQYQG